MSRLIIVGGGGNGSDVLSILEAQQAAGQMVEIVGILDDNTELDLGRFAGRAAYLGPIERLDDFEADGYILGKCGQYSIQLARYRDLVRDGTGASALPIRLALYFPEWPAERRWQDITDLVDADDTDAST